MSVLACGRHFVVEFLIADLFLIQVLNRRENNRKLMNDIRPSKILNSQPFHYTLWLSLNGVFIERIIADRFGTVDVEPPVTNAAGILSLHPIHKRKKNFQNEWLIMSLKTVALNLILLRYLFCYKKR